MRYVYGDKFSGVNLPILRRLLEQTSTILHCVTIRDTYKRMIISFRHKGLEIFYSRGSTRGIQATHVPKLRNILGLLDATQDPQELSLPSLKLHQLKGDLKGYWSVWVNGNWRITFRFVGPDVELVDYQDYH